MREIYTVRLCFHPYINVLSNRSGPVGVMSKMYSSAETGESKSNLKYRAIKKSMTGLVDLIDATGTMKVALRLFQEDFLNESTYYGLEESKTGDGARKIVGELLKKMKVNPDERYEKLMEVLDEEKMLDAVRLIKKKYNGKCIIFLETFNPTILPYVVIHRLLF